MSRSYTSKKNFTPTFEILMASGILIQGILFPAHAPESVGNFIELANSGYYDQSCVHRCVTDFIVHCGQIDPPLSYCIKGEFEFNDHKGKRLSAELGSLCMARLRHYCSASSEFFIIATPNERKLQQLNGAYAIFGKITSGMEDVIALANVSTDHYFHPVDEQIITSIRVQTGDHAFSFSKLSPPTTEVNTPHIKHRIQSTRKKVSK